MREATRMTWRSRELGCCGVGLRGLEPRTSSLSGKPMASATIFNPVSELALLSVGVRCCMPAVVAVVTQLVTQAGRAHGSGGS
jgi:hypothetical protein